MSIHQVSLVLLLVSFSLLSVAGGQTMVYVDQNAPGANDGTSWDDAYVSLQTALDFAVSGSTIRVADGTYSPGSSPYASFTLYNGVSLEGSFAGFGATDPDKRNFQLHETVLDGMDTNYHVVYGINIDSSSVIDGFTITRGNASAHPSSNERKGGGILLDHASPIITRCKVVDNAANYGGGLYALFGEPSISHCQFLSNTATRGGGIDAPGADIVLSHCLFKDNQCSGSLNLGGGFCLFSTGTFNISHCTFEGNSAEQGGGIYDSSSFSRVSHCTFKNNTATGAGRGGGVHSSGEDLKITYSLFSGNTAQRGGAISSYWTFSKMTVANCTVFRNHATVVGGGLHAATSVPVLRYCTFSENSANQNGAGVYGTNSAVVQAKNCIFWRDYPEEFYLSGPDSQFQCTYSCIQGGHGGGGNIDDPPLFRDPTMDDYHLTALSPCINQGLNSLPEVDDIEGDARPAMGSVDMGSDEYAGPFTLTSSAFRISRDSGGSIPLTLEAGTAHAGDYYCLVGSQSGTSPGIPLPGGAATLPLNPDGFFDLVLLRLNTHTFQNFIGLLGHGGNDVAQLNIPAGKLPPSWVGNTMYFAYTVGSFTMASNPVEILIMP